MGADGETGKQFTMATLHARLKDYLPHVYVPYTRITPEATFTRTFPRQYHNSRSGWQSKYHYTCWKGYWDTARVICWSRGKHWVWQDGLRTGINHSPKPSQHWPQPTDVYPTPVDIDVDSLESTVPPHLQGLIDAIFTESRSETAVLKKRLLKTGICHVIMKAAGRQSFISPLLLSVGLFIHQTTRSGILLDVLSSLGLRVPYSTVMAFQRSAVLGQRVEDLPVMINRTQTRSFVSR